MSCEKCHKESCKCEKTISIQCKEGEQGKKGNPGQTATVTPGDIINVFAANPDLLGDLEVSNVDNACLPAFADSKLRTILNSIIAFVCGLATDIAGIIADIALINAAITLINAAITTINTTLTSLQNQINVLTTNLTNLTTIVTNITNTIDSDWIECDAITNATLEFLNTGGTNMSVSNLTINAPLYTYRYKVIGTTCYYKVFVSFSFKINAGPGGFGVQTGTYRIKVPKPPVTIRMLPDPEQAVMMVPQVSILAGASTFTPSSSYGEFGVDQFDEPDKIVYADALIVRANSWDGTSLLTHKFFGEGFFEITP